MQDQKNLKKNKQTKEKSWKSKKKHVKKTLKLEKTALVLKKKLKKRWKENLCFEIFFTFERKLCFLIKIHFSKKTFPLTEKPHLLKPFFFKKKNFF